MAEIDVNKATADPEDLTLVSPKVAEPEIPFIKRVFPNQSWSTIMAVNFIMMHENDLRDNDVLSDIVAASMSVAIESVTQDELDALYEASVERREDTDLDPIEEDTYKTQRDPVLLRDFVSNILVALGLERDLAEDLTEAIPDDRIVAIVDEAVAESREVGTASEIEARAEAIAKKLGLEYVPPETLGKNLIVPEVYETDSTDPYIKKVID